MIRLNGEPIELNGKKWVFYGGVYQYGKPTIGGYIALNPALRRKKKYTGMENLVKKMFCEGEESYLDMRNWHRTLLKLKPEFEKLIRGDDVKGGKEK